MSEPVTMTTYKLADPKLAAMFEFGWVVDLDYFDDGYVATHLIKEVWVRQSVEDYTHHPSPCFCEECEPDD